MVQHGAHPAVGGDLRGLDPGLVRDMRRLLALLLASGLGLTGTTARAQGNVTRIVVPFGAGGVQDVLARSISPELGAALGRSVIVENRPGAGGTIGTASVAKAAPDGHTLILAAASHTINGSLYASLPYDPIRDFTGVAHIGTSGYVLMIGAALPAKTVAEFVSYARANPGKLNYATAGNGSATHLSMAYFAGLAGLDMVHVPYKATGEAVSEVLAGRLVRHVHHVQALEVSAGAADHRRGRRAGLRVRHLVRAARAGRDAQGAGGEHQCRGRDAAQGPVDPRSPGEAGRRAAAAQPRRVQCAAARRFRQDGEGGQGFRRAHRLNQIFSPAT